MRAPRNLPFLLKVYFIVGSIVLVTLALYYNNSLIRRMRAQSESTTQLFSKFIAIGLSDIQDINRREFIGDVRNSINLPIVITDERGVPMFWNRIGVPIIPDDQFSRLLDFDPESPNDPLIMRVLAISESFDRINEPVKIETEMISWTIHYGPSKLSRELAIAPYIQVAVFVLFMLFGFLGFRAMKIGEQRSIWVGMAKETAHQLGTPLSSVMGWLEMIRIELGGMECSEKLSEAITETTTDVERLSKISARFSKIGSMPKLEYQKLAPIITETVDYFERRRPSLKMQSTITIEMEELPLLRCSRDLLEWVFENLIKNSIDAIAGEEGKIHIDGKMDQKENKIVITFRDNGKGMNPGLKNQIFSPGFTTKNRGWGLGLALAKRIVEDIHHGSIRVLHTSPGKGTSFLITFPVD
jgi:signal transduction histidine kinase